MSIGTDSLEQIARVSASVSGPLTIPWPAPGNLAGLSIFEAYARWEAFVLSFGLSPGIPDVVAHSFERAQKLYLLGWIDHDLIIAGELIVLTTLDLALRDRYFGKIKQRRMRSFVEKAEKENRSVSEKEMRNAENISLSALLEHMIEDDGLTDEQLPIVKRYGASVCPFLTGDRKPSLADVRNAKAHALVHGAGLESGLLELVRDLIDYIYRAGA